MNLGQVKELLPKEFSKQRNAVFVDKAFRDARILREKARFVVILDRNEQGDCYCREVIDNTNVSYIASVIAVLAPVHLFRGGFTLDQGLVLEVGLSRGRPYTQAEVKSREIAGVRYHVKKRRKLRDISFPELEAAWPKITDFLRKATTELQNGRSRLRDYIIPGHDFVREVGMRITVSKEDRILYWKVVTEDERCRTRHYLVKRAKWITESLRPYIKSKVSGKRFKKLKGVVAVAGVLMNMRRYTFAPNHLMRKLISLLPQNVRGIFEEVVDAYGLSKFLSTLRRDPKFSPDYLLAQRLSKLSDSYLIIKRKQGRLMKKSEGWRRQRQIGQNGNGNAHAQGCIVAEYYFRHNKGGRL